MSHNRYKKALIITGESDTGKSKVLDALRFVLDNENTCCISLEVMGDAKRLPPIMGKRATFWLK